MNLSLSSEIQRLIEMRVKSGQYQSAEEVITAALLTLDQQERVADLAATELDRLYPGFQAKLDAGLAAARNGQFVDGGSVLGGSDIP
jgi:putative addiction module CopG family antidote